jgi:actin-like ATPase involved in cell morphogenesis
VTYDLGVDLGTTYTCVARARGGRIELVQLGHTSPLVASVVSMRDVDVFVIGEAAERRAITDPSRTVREFKRRLGDEAPYVIGGKPFGAEVLAAELLQHVVAQVRDAEGEPPRRIALTHPANYGPFKLGKLREAAALAGIDEPMLVPEPVAAALSYADRERVPDGGYVLVYDLGGGTFDVAVVQIAASGPAVVGTPDGLERLGGIDFDAAVLNHVDRTLGGRVHAADANNAETRAALARLRDECRSAKEALSSDTETQIPVLLPDVHETVRLTRSELEQMLRPRLEDTFLIVDRVVSSAGIAMADVSAILTVGGSSRIPLVAQMLSERTQRPVAVDPNPKASVALGAAAVAARETRAVADATVAVPIVPTADADTEVAATTAGDDDATDTGAPAKRKRGLLVAALVALVLIGGGAAAAFALGGGGGGGADGSHDVAGAQKVVATSTTARGRASKSTTSTGPFTTTSAGTASRGGSRGGSRPSSGGSSGNGSTNVGGAGNSGSGNTNCCATSGGTSGGTRTTSPPHTNPPATPRPTTTTTRPQPSVTASVAQGNPVVCPPGSTAEKTVVIVYSSTNTNRVDIGQFNALPPNGQLAFPVSCATLSPNHVAVNASGPYGVAFTTVSWAVLQGTS